jgi:excisionase family DNA binding protein
MDEKFVPIEDIAEHFAVSVSTVRAWIRQDLIPALKIGGVYRFKISDVERTLRELNGGDLPVEEKDGSIRVKVDPHQLALDFSPEEDV